MFDLGQVFPSDWPGVPPHMAPRDLPLWRRFQGRFSGEFQGCHFDVAIGRPGELPPGTPERDRRMWERITAKRIDAVCLKPTETWVIEVRPAAGFGAVGAVVGYRRLWERERPPLPSPRFIIVTDEIDPDVQDVADSQEIGVIII